MDGKHLLPRDSLLESKMKMLNTAGFEIEEFGQGRNAIQAKYANDLVDALNILGRIRILRGTKDEVVYGENGLFIQLKDTETDSAGSSANPFRIYRTTSWLDYKVTTGIAITTGNPITVTATETNFTLSPGVLRYWFYIEMTATTAEVKKSATTLTWSELLIPIGWVDTLTGESEESATIYQALRDNIFNPCAT